MVSQEPHSAHSRTFRDAPGTRLGSGVIVQLIGEGGAARVYAVHNKRYDVFRAVKLLKPGHSPNLRARFEREMHIMPGLHHPNIATVFDTGLWHGLPYIEMELVNGFSLDALLARRGAMPLLPALATGVAICRALSYVHSHEFMVEGKQYHGLLHRDLKPANVLISTTGAVKLTDFGAARNRAADNPAPDQLFVGSLQYVAPEELKSDAVEPRSDIFSLGCVLFEILTGSRAFTEKDMHKLIATRVSNAHAPLSSLPRGVPRALRELIARCLAASPQERPASVDSIHETLSGLLRRRDSQTPEQIVRAFVAGPRPRGIWHSSRGEWLPRVTRMLSVSRIRIRPASEPS